MTTSSLVAVLRVRCSPRACPRTRPGASFCWRRAPTTRRAGNSRRPSRLLADVPADTRLGLDRRGRPRAGHSVPSRPGDRRLLGRQRRYRPTRHARGLRRVGRAGQRRLGLEGGAAVLSPPRRRPSRRRGAPRSRRPDRDPPLATSGVDPGPAGVLRRLPPTRVPRGRRSQPSRGNWGRPVPTEPAWTPTPLHRDRLPAARPPAAQPRHQAELPGQPRALRRPGARRRIRRERRA